MMDNSALDAKTKKSEEKREQIMNAANKEIEDFYANRREAIEKAKKQRRFATCSRHRWLKDKKKKSLFKLESL